MPNFYLKAKTFLLISFWLVSLVAFAQERFVSGKIIDETGESIPGVNVLVKGTTLGTSTNGNGEYKISLPNSPDLVLTFSFIGYLSEEVIIGPRTVVDVTLTPAVTTLTELVVTGYAVQEKKDVTGSVGVVKAKELNAIPSANVGTLLQGRVAGLTVTTSGQPGAASSVRIRGFSSFGNNSPLYVVDGVQTLDISTLNPNDIESMNVLKDAGAASIYGSRANNGVIIITTMHGKKGKLKLSYDVLYGSQVPGKGFSNILDPQGMANLSYLAAKNANQDFDNAQFPIVNNGVPVLPDYILAGDKSGVFEGDPAVDLSLYNIDYAKGDIYQIVNSNKTGTNWFKEVTHAAPIQNHNLSVAGGNESSKYMIGFNYINQQGIVRNTYLKRYSMRINTEFNFKKRIRIGENFQGSFSSNPSISNFDEGNAISMGYRMQPIVPVHDVKGNWAGSAGKNLGDGFNPVAEQARTANNTQTRIRLLGNAFAEVDFLKDLTFRTSFGGSLVDGYGTAYTYHTYERAENNGTTRFDEAAYYTADWNWSNTFTYKKAIGRSNLLVVAGTEAVKSGIGRNLGGSRLGYFIDDPTFWTLDNGPPNGQNNTSSVITPATLLSYFARADYSFNDRFFLSATVRRDGSSKFSQQFGTFPSITGAWRISKEKFLENASWLNDLKLRAGYGTMGGQNNVLPYNQYNITINSISNSYYDITGTSNSPTIGTWQSSTGNPIGKWETNITKNIGIDASFFNSKLEVTLDLYQKDTKDLLFQIDKPATVGAGQQPFRNIAQMQNKGVDLQVLYRGQISTNWRYEANLTFTSYRNKIVKLADDISFFDTDGGEENRIGARFVRNMVGAPISSFFGYKVIGLFQTQQEVDASNQEGAGVGRFKYDDTNHDGSITPDDRTIIGNPNPNFSYGLNLNIGYKSFDLTVFLYGVQGKDLMNYTRWWTDFVPSFQGAKSNNALYGSWSETNKGAHTPIAENESNLSTNQGSKSYFVENGSYLRAKNIQLSYTLPISAATKLGLERLKFYVQGVNLFTVTKYSGLDPELGGNDTNFGIDYGNYPMTKQYIVGLNLQF